MTEEIIIDGVNVAGCANLDSLICNCGVICKGRNCYYKELKRLEFELKVTKADYEASEQENKELKSQRDEARIAYNGLILDIVSDIPFKGEIGGEREISIKDHLHQMQKALASLEEIREIAKDIIENDVYENSDVKAENILTKINEVLK